MKEIAHIADDIKNDNPLIVAAFNKDIETVRKLIEQGEDVNIKGAFNWSPLIHAVANCDVEMTKLLLDSGAELDKNINKFTCMHVKQRDFTAGEKITAFIQEARVNKLRKKHIKGE